MDDTNTLRTAAQAVVDVFAKFHWPSSLKVAELREPVTALAAALAQPEPAPTPLVALPAVVDAEAQPMRTDMREPWLLYLSDRADGVKGHFAIARWTPRGVREVWNLHTHEWAAFSDDVLTREQAEELLKRITIPTMLAPASGASTEVQAPIPQAAAQTPAPEARKPLSDDQILTIACRGADKCHGFTGRALYVAREVERAHGIQHPADGAEGGKA